MAPANVSGRLFSLPTTAAPYAPATNNVSTIGSSDPRLAASRMPDSAASTEPSIQLYRAIGDRRRAVQGGQRGVVDNGAHRDAGAAHEQEAAEHDGDRDGEHDGERRCPS